MVGGKLTYLTDQVDYDVLAASFNVSVTFLTIIHADLAP